MNNTIVNKLKMLQKQFNTLKTCVKSSTIINSKNNFLSSPTEYSTLYKIIIYFKNWTNIQNKILLTKKISSNSNMSNFIKDELEKGYISRDNIEKKIESLLLPKDPNDQNNCFIELRAGTGGKEAAIFTRELFRMYIRYLESYRWNTEIIHRTYGDYGGYKEIIAKISHSGSYRKLKFESGGHRVQRIPNTDSQGRIHTSTCTVAVIPEVPQSVPFDIHSNDLRIDTFRASGAGGQHVNTTDSAIRITHIPTGLSVACQNERSQHKNKAKALSILSSRLYTLKMQHNQEKTSKIRRNLIGTGDRSDRIRTYNFHQGRVTDHRINFTSHKLNDVMNGNLDILIQPIIDRYQITLLDQLLDLK